MKTSFKRSAEALAIFDAGAPARDAAWSAVECDADVFAAEAADVAAANLVREAFALDTQAFNRREDCMRVGLNFIRKASAS